MNRATVIKAKFKARPKLDLPANYRFCKRHGKRFLKLLSLERGFRPREFSWIKCPSAVRSTFFPPRPFNWRSCDETTQTH
jgi:hypothetical protein